MESTDIMKKYAAVFSAVVLLAVSAFGAFKINEHMTGELNKLKATQKAEEKKNKLLDDIRVQEKQVKAYNKFLNAKDPAMLLSVLGGMAKDASVKLTSIKPAAEVSEKYYVKYPFELRVESPSYHQLGVFLSMLESNQDVFMVENALITPIRNSGASQAKVTLTLTVSSIMAKE